MGVKIPGTLLTVTNVWQQVFTAFEGHRLFFFQNLHVVQTAEIMFGPDPDVSGDDSTFILAGGVSAFYDSRTLGSFTGEVWVRAMAGNIDMLTWEIQS